jgi:hypothetical protein
MGQATLMRAAPAERDVAAHRPPREPSSPPYGAAASCPSPRTGPGAAGPSHSAGHYGGPRGPLGYSVQIVVIHTEPGGPHQFKIIRPCRRHQRPWAEHLGRGHRPTTSRGRSQSIASLQRQAAAAQRKPKRRNGLRPSSARSRVMRCQYSSGCLQPRSEQPAIHRSGCPNPPVPDT